MAWILDFYKGKLDAMANTATRYYFMESKLQIVKIKI